MTQKVKLKNLLSEMTLEEKIGQMTQVDFSVIAAPEQLHTDNPIDQARLENAVLTHHVGSILNLPYNKAQSIDTWRKMTQTVQTVAAKSRLKIPVIYGLMQFMVLITRKRQFCFLKPLTWRLLLTPNELQGRRNYCERNSRFRVAMEFSPVMDIGRQPLWPRLWETYGEDVHLASVLGTSFIKVIKAMIFSAPNKAPTCLKHYVGYSFPINGKDRTPAWIGEKNAARIFFAYV